MVNFPLTLKIMYQKTLKTTNKSKSKQLIGGGQPTILQTKSSGPIGWAGWEYRKCLAYWNYSKKKRSTTELLQMKHPNIYRGGEYKNKMLSKHCKGHDQDFGQEDQTCFLTDKLKDKLQKRCCKGWVQLWTNLG